MSQGGDRDSDKIKRMEVGRYVAVAIAKLNSLLSKKLYYAARDRGRGDFSNR